MIPCVSVSGILILIWPHCTTSGPLIAFCILYGFASGAFVSLPPAVIASISTAVPANKIGVRVGQAFTFAAFATLSGTPISGACLTSDGGRQGGYVKMSLFAGCVVLAGGIILAVARVRWNRGFLVKV